MQDLSALFPPSLAVRGFTAMTWLQCFVGCVQRVTEEADGSVDVSKAPAGVQGLGGNPKDP